MTNTRIISRRHANGERTAATREVEKILALRLRKTNVTPAAILLRTCHFGAVKMVSHLFHSVTT